MSSPGTNPASSYDDFKQSLAKAKHDIADFRDELIHELTLPHIDGESKKNFVKSSKFYFHLPYFPIIHQPGWLLQYITGPYTDQWAEQIFSDVWAGITVGLTLIPQGLSYATLANLQPISGLYASILPIATYVIFGTSLKLGLGPVAVVSLLTGQIVAKYVPEYSNPAFYEDAANVGAEVALAMGTIMTVLSIFNFGTFIRYVSYPVISGFTSGAACVIGLNQLGNAFGFSNSDVPQQGQPGYDYNYQVMRWFRVHWYDRWHYTASQLAPPTTPGSLSTYRILRNGNLFRNKDATEICFGLVAILLVILYIKSGFKETPERSKKISFRIWKYFSALCSFFGIIISAHIAYNIKKRDSDISPDPNYLFPHNYDAYYLRIVGAVPSGLDFIKLRPLPVNFIDMIGQAIPVSLIAYMESYSVARRIASQRGELHILNASQELWANGIANLAAYISSAYPVSGSFSRSALNNSCGAYTPLSSIATMVVIIVAIGSLSSTFNYIPRAALSAVIIVAIHNLISFSELWEAFRNNKKDFIVMLVTWVVVLTFNTEIGLASGLGLSVVMFLIDTVSSEHSSPLVAQTADENDGVAVVRLRQDVTFLTCSRLRDVMQPLFFVKPSSENNDRLLSRVYFNTTQMLDYLFIFNKPEYATSLPKAIVVDFFSVAAVDLSGLETLNEIQVDVRRYKVKIVVINCIPSVESQLVKYGFQNDCGSEVDSYLKFAGGIPLRKSSPSSNSEYSQVESKEVDLRIISTNDVKDSNESAV